MKVKIRIEFRLHIQLWYIFIDGEIDKVFNYRDDAREHMAKIEKEYSDLGYDVEIDYKTKFTF